MDEKVAPLLPKKVLTEKITVQVTVETKRLWDTLRDRQGFDLPEYTRMFWSEKLPKLQGSGEL